MTPATDTDIRELKTAIEAIVRVTEANTRAIEAINRGTEANTRAIADLTLEMRLGFASVDIKLTEVKGQINNVETKLEGKIETLNSKLGNLESTDTFNPVIHGVPWLQNIAS
jgi:hypothetical protein